MAGSSLGRLTLDLVARIGQFVQPLNDAERQTARASQRMQQSLSGVADGVKNMMSSFAGIAAIYSAIDAADKFTGVRNKLILVTNSQNDLNAAMKMSFDIAQNTGSSWEGVSTIYQRFAQNADRLGLSQQKVADITNTVSKALAMSGGSIESQNAAIMQFGQGLGSGVLRGEEFNSVMEGGLGLAQALATGLNVPIGRLRGMAEQGQLTADVIVDALGKAAKKVDEDYAKTASTIGAGFQRVRDAYTKFIGENDGGGAAALGGALSLVAKNLDLIANTGAAVAVGYVAKTISAATIATTQHISATMAAMKADQAAIALRVRKAQAEVNAAQAEMSSARAAVLNAEMKVAADRTVIASEINRLKSTQAQLVAEKALEAQRHAAQINAIGRAASVARMAGLQQTQAIITRELQAAEAQLAATTTASSTAYVAARNAQTAATGRLAAANLELGLAQRATTASSIGLMGMLGGSAGLIGLIAMVGAGMYLFRDSADEASKAIDRQGKSIADLTEEYKKLTLAQAVVESKALRDEIKEQEKAIDGVVGKFSDLRFSISASDTKSIELYVETFKKIEKGAITGNGALTILKKSGRFEQSLIDSVATYAVELDKANGKATSAKDANKLLNNVTDNLTKSQAAAADAANDHAIGLGKTEQAAKDAADAYDRYIKSLSTDKLKLKIEDRLLNFNFTDNQRKELAKLYEAYGDDPTKTRGSKFMADRAAALEIARIQDSIDARKKAATEAAKADKKEESDAVKKANREKEQRQSAFDNIVDISRSETKVIKDKYATQSALIKEFTRTGSAEQARLMAYAQNLRDDDLEKFRIATVDKIYSYDSYSKTEEELVKRHYAKLRDEARIDNDLRKQNRTQWAIDQLQKEEQLEIASIKNRNEQALLSAQAYYAQTTDYMKARYSAEREEIMLTAGKSEEWRQAMLQGVNAKESNDMYGQKDQAWTDWQSAGLGDNDRYKALQGNYDAELEIIKRNEELRNITVEEAAKRRLQAEKDYSAAKYSLVAGSGADIVGSLAASTKTMFGDQSKAYKRMLKIQQGFALAQALINIPKTASEAYSAMAGIPYIGPALGVAAAAAAVAAQAANVAAIRGTQLPDAGFMTGGYTGDAPTNAVAGVVHGQEYVFDAPAVKNIGRDNLEALRQGKLRTAATQAKAIGQSASLTVNIENHGTSKQFEVQQLSEAEVRVICRDEAPRAVAADLGNPNSPTSKAMRNNYQVQRAR